MKSERIEISKDMTDDFYKVARFGQILRFRDEDNEIGEYKIVRLNRKSKICIVKPFKTYTVEEFNEMTGGEDERKD